MKKVTDFKALEGGNKKDKEVEGAIQYFKDNSDQILEAFKAKAYMSRVYYTSLIEEGFTVEEALEIVKHDESV